MLSRLAARLGILFILSAAFAGIASAAELVMFRSDGCSWCAKWDREIRPIYPKTEYNRRAPLRQINLDHDAAASFVHAPIHYTPTFVLVDNGREVGRIEGYPGDEFFWGRLEGLLEKLPKIEPLDLSAPMRIRFDVPRAAP
jgi:hypothetical protein